MKTYRLLRDNKESGPFSADELLKLGLKAYDLVWVEGKSAAWRYPSELTEFKSAAPVVEEQPFDRFYKRGKDVEKPSKPRFRIRADWRKLGSSAEPPPPAVVSMPVYPPQPLPAVAATAHPPIATVPVPSPATDKSNTLQIEETRPEVRYSESLDSIKERYSRTVLQRRQAFADKKPLQYALIVLPVLILGIVIGSRWHGNQTEQKETIVNEQPAAATMAQALTIPADQNDTDEPGSVATPAVTETPAALVATATRPVVNSLATDKKVVHTDKPLVAAANTRPALTTTKSAVNKPLHKQPIAVTTGGGTPVLAKNGKPVTTSAAVVKNNALQTAPPVTQAVVRTTAAPAPAKSASRTVTAASTQVYEAPATGKNRIADYVSVKDEYAQEDGGRRMKLHVQNKSNIPVDLVVLDLQYYDNNGKFRKGETLYVNNLSANDEVALSAPAVKNTQRIDYKVSLLSIEKKGIYLIAE